MRILLLYKSCNGKMLVSFRASCMNQRKTIPLEVLASLIMQDFWSNQQHRTVGSWYRLDFELPIESSPYYPIRLRRRAGRAAQQCKLFYRQGMLIIRCRLSLYTTKGMRRSCRSLAFAGVCCRFLSQRKRGVQRVGREWWKTVIERSRLGALWGLVECSHS